MTVREALIKILGELWADGNNYADEVASINDALAKLANLLDCRLDDPSFCELDATTCEYYGDGCKSCGT